jgi:hypothetical protein
MDFVGAMYATLGITMLFSIFGIVGFIAGKDIIFAFKRRFMPKGCTVYIVNTNRNISEYYLVPKKGVFTIDKLPYVTNPDKVLNLSNETKLKIVDSMLKHKEKLKKRIFNLISKKEQLQNTLDSIKNPSQKNVVMAKISSYESLINELKTKLDAKLENYFKDRKPCFLYIEGDPVPKDIHEYISTMDNQILDNMVARKISEPDGKREVKTIEFMKMLVIGATIAAVLAALMSFSNNNGIMELCRQAGLTCKLV